MSTLNLSPPTNFTAIIEAQHCQLLRSAIASSYPVLLVHFSFILISSKLLYLAVRRLYQPRIVADLVVSKILHTLHLCTIYIYIPV